MISTHIISKGFEQVSCLTFSEEFVILSNFPFVVFIVHFLRMQFLISNH